MARMADAAAAAKAATGSIKRHWLTFALIGFGLVVLALWYDHKNQGALTAKLAKLPIVGGLFS
jgi:hypothetical protein